jgi:hypothetical protein
MTRHWQAYHLNRMIQDCLKNPPQMGQLMSGAAELFDRYQVTEAERAVFRKPTGAALRSLGIHPILAMIYMIPHDEPLRNKLTISPEHLQRMKELY